MSLQNTMLFLALATTLGCKPGSSETPTTPLDPRPPHRLALDVDSARELVAKERDERFETIRASWFNRRYRWTGFMTPILCRNPATCTVSVFDRTGRDSKIKQGWRPTLKMNPEEFAKMKRGCQDARLCRIEFEGAMSELELSAHTFESVGFSQVKILDARIDPRVLPHQASNGS